MSDHGRVGHTSHSRVIAWALVAGQAILIGAVVFVPRRPMWDGVDWLDAIAWVAIGAALLLGLWGAAHLGSGLTPSPLPNGAVGLVTRGPYRWIRHPIYSAVILGVSGTALKSRTAAALVLAAGLGVFLGLKARWEEGHLRDAFAGYADYAEKTGRFLPRRG